MAQTIFPSHNRSWLPWTIVLFGSTLTAALPFILFRLTMGSWLPEILPQTSADSWYYIKQMREVIDGHPWLGNPFIREYADAHFPGLLLPMWIGAVPGLLGLSVNNMFAFNAFVYTVLTGALLYVLCMRTTRGNIPLSVVVTLVSILSLHNLLLRPVMQIVYPALAVFLLCLLEVLAKPHHPWRYLWLGLTATFTFYLYPHLWMPVFAAIGFLFLRALNMRDWKAIRLMMAMGAGVAVACLPQILNIIQLFSDPMAKALNFRTGMVETHRVLPLTILNLKYMMLVVLSLLLVRQRRVFSHPELIFLLISGSILAAALSNVVTGKEMDFETHPLWVSFMVNALAIAVFACPPKNSDRLTWVVSGMLVCAFVFTTTARTMRNSLPYLWRFDVTAPRQVQDYQRIFTFLQDADIRESAILAPNAIGNYIPMYSDSYVLYAGWTVLHVIPDEELLERFLVQYADATEEYIKENVSAVRGWGSGRAAAYRNAYGDNVNALEFIGGEAFIGAALEKHRDVRAHYEEYLQKYRIDLVITDTEAPDNPRVPNGASTLYRDDRFTIYRL